MVWNVYPRRAGMRLAEFETRAGTPGSELPGFGWPTAAAPWTVPADLVESPAGLRLELEVPGLGPEDIEVTVENDVLTVSGEKRPDASVSEAGAVRTNAERRFGRFTRRFRLPRTVDAAGIKAEHRQGVLTIVVPRAESARPRRVPVAGGKQEQRSTGADA